MATTTAVAMPTSVRCFLAVASQLFVVAAVFHFRRLLSPEPADPSGATRHLLFVGINLACAAGLILRPRFFRFAFVALAIQQVLSHGATAWYAWSERSELDLVSWVIVAIMPAVAILLWRFRDGEAAATDSSQRPRSASSPKAGEEE